MEGRVIIVRRLVALDITLHGSRFIMLEFGVGTPAILAVGGFLAATGQPVLGLYLLLTGINYVPLLIYAALIARAGSAEREVASGLSQDAHYVRKYSTQQLLDLRSLRGHSAGCAPRTRQTDPGGGLTPKGVAHAETCRIRNSTAAE